MAITNTAHLTIDGKYYTRSLVFAPKNGNFLDEQLDEGYLTVKHIRREAPFPRLAVVRLITEQTLKLDSFTEAEEKTPNKITYLVASDSVNETPVGSGLYDHELYVIEATKFLELLVCDSVTFTNVQGKDYTNNPIRTQRVITQQSSFADTFNTPFVSPVLPSTVISIPPVQDVVIPVDISVGHNFRWDFRYITLRYPNGNEVAISGENGGSFTANDIGEYVIKYYYQYSFAVGDRVYSRGEFYYVITTIQNKLPLKRITCKDVVDRLLTVVEPRLLGEVNRISLDGDTAEKLDKIYAPEFTMTKCTLREALKQVGEKVHGEPRLIIDEGGEFILTFDFYGGTERSSAIKRKYSAKGISSSINNYCTSIDTSAENLVSRQNYAVGVITEPFKNGFKTVRTEQKYIRVTDENMIISTDRAIDEIQSVKIGLVSKNGTAITSTAYEIKDYIFEKTLYDTQCSSFKQDYPYSKAYALYFSRGEKNVYGLNFKAEDDNILFPAFGKYAIINILEKITGQTISSADYPLLAFQVTYIPYFNVRVSQTKLNLNDYEQRDLPAVMPYNQGANLIDTTYFGENLKGVVSRLGNVEKTYTYVLPFFENVPKAGTMFDDEYYISTVATETYPSFIKCTIGLSKDFNRLSEYINVSSNKRMYEVSELATFDRSVLYKEYVVVGNGGLGVDPKSLLGSKFKTAVKSIFSSGVSSYAITHVKAWGGTYQNPEYINGKYPLPMTVLPVTSTALGNAVVFIWNYADNYSAGETVAYSSNAQGVSGYYQDDYRYTDSYGKIYYYNFDLGVDIPTDTDLQTQSAIGLALPHIDEQYISTESNNYISTQLSAPYVLRKDNREILQFNMQVEFVSNRDRLYIGSAFAGSLPLIGASHQHKPKCYALKFPLNKLTQSLSMTGAEFDENGVLLQEYGEEIRYDIRDSRINEGGYEIVFYGSLPCDCKSIVFITDISTTSERVETEEGEELTQTVVSGGEMVLCYIREFSQGDFLDNIYISFIHDVFSAFRR